MGYFKKRLRDSGYIVSDLYKEYGYTDPRAWSVVIDPGVASVFCTCYINGDAVGDSYFEIYDGGQHIGHGRVKIQTNSIEVFISYLVKYGINNKSRRYNKATSGEEDTPKEPVKSPSPSVHKATPQPRSGARPPIKKSY